MNHKVPGDLDSLPVWQRNQTGNHRLPESSETGSATTRGADNAGIGHSDLKWCTMSCEHADWPKENVDGAKSCRTFNALWCNALCQHVTRNTPCALLHGARRPKANW